MQDIDLLIHAGWVLPMSTENCLLKKHCVAIHDHHILDILPSSESSQHYQAKETILLENQLIMPGLINAHTHSPMTLFRGVADDRPLMDWLTNYIWPLEKKHINANSTALGCELAIAEMIRGGTTTFCDYYFFPDVIAQVANQIGIRCSVGLPLFSSETCWAQNEEEHIEKIKHLLTQASPGHLITYALAPHAPYTVSDSGLSTLKLLAEQYNLITVMHLHETADEIQQSLKSTGRRPLAHLHELQLLSNKFVAIHGVHFNQDDIDLLKKTETQVVHCPESNLKLASGFAEINTLQKAGINVALGTDGAASNNDLDMFGELKTAALLAKAVAQDASALPAYQALEIATINGAKALGISHITGSLEKGKAADLISIDLSDNSMQPLYNCISQIVYAGNREFVSNVWVHGKRLLKDGVLTCINQAGLNEKLRDWKQ